MPSGEPKLCYGGEEGTEIETEVATLDLIMQPGSSRCGEWLMTRELSYRTSFMSKP